MYLGGGLFRPGDEIVTLIAIAQSDLCIQNGGLLLGHRQTRRLNIEATLVGCPVIAVDAGVQKGCVWSGLEWC